jgi:hypothetical protein
LQVNADVSARFSAAAAALALAVCSGASASPPSDRQLGATFEVLAAGQSVTVEIRLKPRASFDSVRVEAGSGVGSLTPPCAFTNVVPGGSYVCRVNVTHAAGAASLTLNVVGELQPSPQTSPGRARIFEVSPFTIANPEFVAPAQKRSIRPTPGLTLKRAAAAAPGAAPAAPAGAQAEAPILPPERIRRLLPSSVGNLTRGDISAENITALGVHISQAEAQYRDSDGRYITLRIEDTGGASGLKSLVPWASAGRSVHEKWQPASAANAIGYGEYALVVARRYLIEASGQVSRLDALRSAVRSVDTRKLQSLQSGGGRARKER